MNVRFSVTCAHALVVLLTASTLFAQTRDGKVANAASSAAAGKTWTPEKTPWGDPDLQAVWSGDSAFGIPLQRPVELGTKAELTDQEFADKVKRDKTTRQRAENAVGSFRNDNSWLTRSFRQTSLIIDPPDGRAPALVAGVDQRRTPQGTSRQRPAQ